MNQRHCVVAIALAIAVVLALLLCAKTENEGDAIDDAPLTGRQPQDPRQPAAPVRTGKGTETTQLASPSRTPVLSSSTDAALEFTILDRHDAPIAGARVRIEGTSGWQILETNQRGMVRGGEQRITTRTCEVVITAPGRATSRRFLDPASEQRQFTVTMPPSASLHITVRDSDKNLVPFQDVEVQVEITDRVNHPETIAKSATRRTDAAGVVVFDDLAAASYVVYSRRRWRWMDAPSALVDLRTRKSVEVVMPVRPRDTYFEIEVRDPHGRFQWRDGWGRNFLIDFEGGQPTHVPEHGLAIVEASILDDPAQAARVRVIAMKNGELAPEVFASGWQAGVIGQPVPLLFVLP